MCFIITPKYCERPTENDFLEFNMRVAFTEYGASIHPFHCIYAKEKSLRLFSSHIHIQLNCVRL